MGLLTGFDWVGAGPSGLGTKGLDLGLGLDNYSVILLQFGKYDTKCWDAKANKFSILMLIAAVMHRRGIFIPRLDIQFLAPYIILI